MNRNLLLIVATVLLVVIGGGVLATGASDDLFQDNVEIDDDEIVLEAADSPEGDVYADTDDGELSVDIDNVNQLAETRVDNVFTATYTGDEEARIHVEDVGDDVTIFEMESGEPVEGEDNAVALFPDDETVTFGVDIDDDEAADDVEIDEITVVGQAVNPAFEVLDIQAEQDQVTAGETVNVEAEIENTGSSFPRTVGLLIADRGDELFDDRTVGIDADATRTVEFEYSTRQPDVGELGIGLDAAQDVEGFAVEPDDDLAATVQVEDPEAEIDVDIVSAGGIEVDEDGTLAEDVSVIAGNEVAVTADLENVGVTDGSDTVELLAGGSSVDTVDVTLDAGETDTVELTFVPTRDLASEAVDLRLETATDESDEVTVDVDDPTVFNIESAEVVTDEPVAGEDELEIEATIVNTGDEPGIARAWVEVDTDRVGFDTVLVDDEETETVTFTVDRAAADDVDVTVFTEDDEEELDPVTIFAQPNPELGDIDAPATVARNQDDEVTVDVEVTNDRPDVTPAAATTDVEIDVGGVTDTDEVTVAGGDTETATVTLDVDELPTGELDITATIDGDEATDTVEVLAAAAFDVRIADATDPVRDDRDIDVDVEVENLGDQTGTETVTLFADDSEIADEAIEVEGGEIATETFAIDVAAEGIDTGILPVTVEGEEDGATDEVDVEVIETPEDPLFRVEGPDVEATEIVQGADEIGPDDASDELGVGATINNLGELEDTQTVELVVGDETVASETVTLGEDESQEVEFDTIPAEDLETGQFDLVISTDDVDRDIGTVLVREAVAPTFAFGDPGDLDGLELEDGDTVEVEVVNRGEVDGDTDVEFVFATGVGVLLEETATDTVSVDADETETAEFEVDLDDGTPRAGQFNGVLDVTVANDDVADARVVTNVDVEFGSLGDAIDAADSFDTVFVGANPEIDSPTVDTESVTIQGVTGEPIGADSTVIEVDADDVVVDGLTLVAESDATGIEITEDANNANIIGVEFEAGDGDWEPAIDDSGTGTSVRFVSVFGDDDGGGVHSTGTDLVVADTEIRNVDRAVELTDGASSALVQNTDLIANTRGIFANDGQHQVQRNNIERNDAAIETLDGLTEADVFVLAPNNWWGSAAGPVFGDDEDTADILSNVELDGLVADTPNLDADFTIAEFEDETLEVFEGETLELVVTVENDGGTAGTSDRQDIELLVDGDVVDSETVQELDPDESETVDLSHQPTELGEFDIQVRSDDDDVEATLLVETEPTPTRTPGTGTGGGAPPAPASPLTDRIGASIDDAAPDEPGTRVAVDRAGFTAVTFEDPDASGFVNVEVYDDVPAGAPALAEGQPFLTGVTLNVPDEQADSPATLEFTVDADDVAAADADADDLVVLRAPDDATDYEELATDATEANGEILVEAETPGFSTFVVSTTDEPAETPEPEEEETPTPDEEETPEPDEETPTPEEETPEEPGAFETPGFGVVVALVALLAAALIAARRRR